MDGDAGSLKEIWKCHFIMHSTILVSSSKYDLLFQTTMIQQEVTDSLNLAFSFH